MPSRQRSYSIRGFRFGFALLALILGAMVPASAATFVVDTTSRDTRLSSAQCVNGTIEGAPSGTPIDEAYVRGDDGHVSLREAICLANHASDPANTVALPVEGTISLLEVDNSDWGNTGLPVVTSDLTLEGNGAIIERLSFAGASFRLFYVAAGARLVLRRVEIVGGIAAGEPGQNGIGGAVLNDGTLEVLESTLTANQARGEGAGSGLGGGIFNRAGSVSLTNSTLYANEAIGGAASVQGVAGQGLGGGVFTTGGTLTLRDATIVDNRADDGGGVYGATDQAAPNLAFESRNSVLGLSVRPNFPPIVHIADCTLVEGAGTIASVITNTQIELGTNCSGTVSGSLGFTGFGDHGGPTSTVAIGPPGVAIDAAPSGGDCLPTDQRGVARPQGAACDLGAFELEQADLSLAKEVSPLFARTGDLVTYTVTVTNHGTSPSQPLFDDGVPAGLTLVDTGNCVDFPPGILTCALVGPLAPGASWSVTITARVGASLQPGTVVTNSASVVGTGHDPNVANNSDSASFTVGGAFDPSIPTLGGMGLALLAILLAALGFVALSRKT